MERPDLERLGVDEGRGALGVAGCGMPGLPPRVLHLVFPSRFVPPKLPSPGPPPLPSVRARGTRSPVSHTSSTDAAESKRPSRLRYSLFSAFYSSMQSRGPPPSFPALRRPGVTSSRPRPPTPGGPLEREARTHPCTRGARDAVVDTERSRTVQRTRVMRKQFIALLTSTRDPSLQWHLVFGSQVHNPDPPPHPHKKWTDGDPAKSEGVETVSIGLLLP